MTIRGIKMENDWISNPDLDKKIFFSHFQEKFKQIPTIEVVSRNPHFGHLSEEVALGIGSMVTMEELKDAFWSCRSDKALGPYEFTFSFIKKC